MQQHCISLIMTLCQSSIKLLLMKAEYNAVCLLPLLASTTADLQYTIDHFHLFFNSTPVLIFGMQ